MNFKTNNDAVVKVLLELNKVEGITETTISSQAMTKVAELLKLNECKTEEDFRAIRNSVVMIYRSFTSMFYPTEKKQMFEAFQEIQSRMSAITAVIDNCLWNEGYEV